MLQCLFSSCALWGEHVLYCTLFRTCIVLGQALKKHRDYIIACCHSGGGSGGWVVGGATEEEAVITDAERMHTVNTFH